MNELGEVNSSYLLSYFAVKKSINIGKMSALINSSIGACFFELNILRAYFKQFSILNSDPFTKPIIYYIIFNHQFKFLLDNLQLSFKNKNLVR